MHIAEGVLSAPILLTGAAVTAALLDHGFRRLPEDKLIYAGLMGAAFFVASLIHVPIGLSNAHLILNGLLGILLGWAAVPVIFVGLLLQGILFQFGGLTVLGVNTATMGLGAVCAGALFRCLSPHPLHKGLQSDCAAFLAGLSAVLISSLLTALALSMTSEGFVAAAVALLIAHLPIMVIEGVISVFVCRVLLKTAPYMLEATNR